MIYIDNDNVEAAVNLGVEEYLVKDTDFQVYTLWRDEPSVIIGKNQDAYAEVDLAECRKRGIKVVRRPSGGGAVYHDLGNFQYTLITKAEDEHENVHESFKIFAEPLVEALKELGLNAEFTGRNDITIDGKKVSGNAQYRHRYKICHHGTLLFDVDTEALQASLKTRPIKMRNKGVKSVVSRVGRIKDYVPDMDVVEFMDYLKKYVIDYYKIKEVFSLDEETMENSRAYIEKYRLDEWNLGRLYENYQTYSEKYDFGLVDYKILVKDGYIKDFRMLGDYFEKKDIRDFTENFQGVKFDKDSLTKAVKDNQLQEYIEAMSEEDLVKDMLEAGGK